MRVRAISSIHPYTIDHTLITAATYYRRSSVETKRLDSLMRSALYASYSGMSVPTSFVSEVFLISAFFQKL